jgi:acetylornithine deacetylase/succinyl-diaminopimelate desuccinylase-like protein
MAEQLHLATWSQVERDRIVSALLEWLRIPSISALPEHAADVRRSAEHCAALLAAAGLENVTVLETAGHPAVYADWLHAGPDAPTVLVYGHHDVQPVDPLDEWISPPFEPVIVDGECRARGAVDDKGQVLYEIEAARGLLAQEGRLPVNLKFLVEGEEEVGSPNFESLLTAERDRLACDAVVVSDTGMLAADRPSVCVGMRGLLALEVEVRTARADLHSGVFGGAVANAAHVVARIVASLHDEHGRVALPGFYDQVRELTPAEVAAQAAVGFDEASWREQAGVLAVAGEAGRSILERTTTRPTCDVTGLVAGFTGEGIKTIVPAVARAKVTFRLVPDQDPERVAATFGEWVRRFVPTGAELRITPFGAMRPARTPVEHPYVAALGRAIERVWGRPPLLVHEGGSGPEEPLARVLAAPLLFLGVGLPDDRIHAPNERLVMDQFWRGLLAAGELWHELAALGRPT